MTDAAAPPRSPLRAAKLAMRAGDSGRAVRLLERGVTQLPDDEDLRDTLADFRARHIKAEMRRASESGDWESAVKVLERAAKAAPDDQETAKLLATCRNRMVAGMRSRIAALEAEVARLKGEDAPADSAEDRAA